MAAEGQQMKLAREVAEKLSNSSVETIGDWPHVDGVPMVKISCAAAELIPTQQYANVTVGPVQVTCFVTPDGQTLFSPEGLAVAIQTVQRLCETAVAEDRETVHVLTRGAR